MSLLRVVAVLPLVLLLYALFIALMLCDLARMSFWHLFGTRSDPKIPHQNVETYLNPN